MEDSPEIMYLEYFCVAMRKGHFRDGAVTYASGLALGIQNCIPHLFLSCLMQLLRSVKEVCKLLKVECWKDRQAV